MNDGEAGGREAQLADADELWLDAAIGEVVNGEAPPDLRPRVAAASANEAAAAAARVDAAHGAPRSVRGLAAAIVLFGALIVGGVLALRRADDGARATAPQGPGRELEVVDGPHLAAHLARTLTIAMTAVRGPDGKRLANEPEHRGPWTEPDLLLGLRAAVAPDGAVAAPFAAENVQAELQLFGEDGFVRLRLCIGADGVRLGTSKFACAMPLPAALATKVRSEWEILAAQKPAAHQRMQVQTQRQLIAAIGSDRTIELVGGPFVLTGSDDDGELPANPAVEFRDASPVPFLVITGVHNLRLCAVGGPVRLLGKSPADVVRCENCVDVMFDGLVIGHDTDVGISCSAPVLTLGRCRNVLVRDCELFGCGTQGIVGENVESLRMERGAIHTCRHAIASFRESKGVAFFGTVFRDCELFQPGFAFDRCERVSFTDCIVRAMNGLVDGSADGQLLFDVTMDEPVKFTRGQIRGNRVRRIASSKLLLVREGVDEGDNGVDVLPGKSGR